MFRGKAMQLRGENRGGRPVGEKHLQDARDGLLIGIRSNHYLLAEEKKIPCLGGGGWGQKSWVVILNQKGYKATFVKKPWDW